MRPLEIDALFCIQISSCLYSLQTELVRSHCSMWLDQVTRFVDSTSATAHPVVSFGQREYYFT